MTYKLKGKKKIIFVHKQEKEGSLVASKYFGKNVRLNLYYFKNGYRIYAYRRDNNKGKDSWVESRATDYPIKTKAEAIKNLNSYKDISYVTQIHPVLRDEGTSMFGGYDYKLEKNKNGI
jgi:hypothetical protein